MKDPTLDIGRMLKAFDQFEVEYLVVGGVAAFTYGASRPTEDLDCVIKRNDANLDKVALALNSINARLRVTGLTDEEARKLPLVIDRHTLKSMGLSTWTTDFGPIDLLAGLESNIHNFQEFDSLNERARVFQGDGFSFRVASLSDVIESKEFFDRPKDRVALEELRRIRDSSADDMYLRDSEIDLLNSLVGKRLSAYGSSKPGVDLGFAVEDVFLEFEDAVIAIREDFVCTDVCGDVSDYLVLRIDIGYSNRLEADQQGGVYYFFKGEQLKATRVHRARLIRDIDGRTEMFDHDALLEFVFETGSLWFLKDELSTPFIYFFTSKSGESPSLPDPSDGWPKTVADNWRGEWIS